MTAAPKTAKLTPGTRVCLASGRHRYIPAERLPAVGDGCWESALGREGTVKNRVDRKLGLHLDPRWVFVVFDDVLPCYGGRFRGKTCAWVLLSELRAR